MNAHAQRLGAGGFPLDDYRTWFEVQSVHFEQHWRLCGEILRVNIKRAANDEGSHAKVEIYAPNERRWNRLCGFHIQAMDCRAVTFMSQPLKPDELALLEKGCEELLDKARLLLKSTPAPAVHAPEIAPSEA